MNQIIIMSQLIYCCASTFIQYPHTKSLINRHSSSIISRSSIIGGFQSTHNSYKSQSNQIRSFSTDDEGISSSQEKTKELSWSNFDYGKSPKLDPRFSTSSSPSKTTTPMEDIQKTSSFDLKITADLESKEDMQLKKRLKQVNESWKNIPDDVIIKGINVIRPFIQEKRVERLEEILEKRTKNVRFLFENPSNPRTIESFGIQDVDIIVDSSKYSGKAGLVQKKGMRTAMGSAKWLTIQTHSSTSEAIQELKLQGYKIYASDLNPKAVDIRDISWYSSSNTNATTNDKVIQDENNLQKICIVMGNEDKGISDEMKTIADVSFILPMKGFAESFNLSVATAITLAHMNNNNSINDDGNNLFQANLSDHEKKYLLLKWMLDSLAQKKIGQLLLKKNDIHLSDIF